MSEKNLLEIKDLHVNVEDKEILHGVNLEVGKDEVHVLMGPNGTGKSTLGYAITGHPKYAITSGQIFFDGEDITEMPVNERAKKGIFLSFQNPLEVPGADDRKAGPAVGFHEKTARDHETSFHGRVLCRA